MVNFDNYIQGCDQDETSNSIQFPKMNITMITFSLSLDAADTWFLDLLLDIFVIES